MPLQAVPPRTVLGDELRAQAALLEDLEKERLARSSPSDLRRADDRLDERLALVDKAIEEEDLAGLQAEVGRLAQDIADLLAAVVAADEKKEDRYVVPLTSSPGMIEAFNDMSFRVPVDSACDAWRNNPYEPSLAAWRRILGQLLPDTRSGVRHAAAGTTRYHGSPQSNQSPIVELLAHVLSLASWLAKQTAWPT